MLHELNIRNLGVIEETTAEFDSGLTVVTGETGAGKTMVVTSLRLLSGHRADASRVRSGADRAVVEGVFSFDASRSPEIADLVEEIGGYVDEGEIIASRTVTSAGRSRAHLAGKTVAAGVLGDFSAGVITIHGQNDQLRLIDPVKQLSAVDEFAGTGALVASYQEKRATWLNLDKDLQRRVKAKRELALETETLQRALETIDEIDPQPGEDEELKLSITRLQAADDLRAQMGLALGAIDGSAGDLDMDAATAVDLVGQAENALRSDDEQLNALADRLAEVNTLLSDIAMEVGQALADVPDPDELEGLLERQAQLRELRKFAVDVDGAIAWREEARQRLASIDVSGEAIEKLRAQVEEARTSMMAEGEALSSERKAAAKKFGAAVTKEIKGLHMAAEIRVDIRQGEPGPHGLDEVEFQLVQGGHANALGSSASGGELSRVMLALEVILAGKGRTMVFDEVDAGVGGKAAVEIGRRLARLAVDNQVIVVTHLPQVAAFADAHAYVAKDATDTSVTSSVKLLDDGERVDELSRMLAGLESETGRAHAEELLTMAQEYRESL
ncbi:DNA repair protein RecN [Corynebacterium urogenitale]|uniref:DNA repair protein RecN n=1 Tax=Corynebacterium urogenitale TaxID=2487892 RepID=A0A5J6ZA91_9CORY|nr:DNA repair protein RecN [Corynebacterium urogenitale]QFQ02259.1 DNA repair protein RecN [Corynebacterium urogenitale]